MGFFTRSEMKRGGKSKDRANLPLEHLHRLGLRGVEDMNPRARTKHMLPTGSENPDVYILGEAPGAKEDEEGRQFIGKSGDLLRRTIPGDMNVRWDNCVRTRPPENRTPTKFELECYRPSVTASIEEAKPKVILAVGGVPLSWCLPGLKTGIKSCRGKVFPVRIGSHECWLCPILHPAYILRIENYKEDDIPGSVWKETFGQDVLRAFRLAEGAPTPSVASSLEADLQRGIALLRDPEDILDALVGLEGEEVAAYDIETNALRPYEKGARVLTFAFASDDGTFAFGWDHPEVSYSPKAKYDIEQSIWETLNNETRYIAHNLPFELEWMCGLFGDPAAARLSQWHDTMAQSYILDERVGTHGLDFLCREKFGLDLKTFSKVGRYLEAEPLDKVMRYNGMDAKYTLRLHYELMKEIEDQGLMDIYEEQVRRTPTLVQAQFDGLPIDVETVEYFQEEYTRDLKELEEEMKEREEVEDFQKRFGHVFNMASHKDVVCMLRDVLDRQEGYKSETKYSSDQSVLEQVADEEPVAEIILEHRRLSKLLGTYVDRFNPKHKKTYTFPDGKIHCLFQSMRTDTGRLSSAEPNNQNWPSRRDSQIRSMVVAPEGYKIVAFDYSQIEARVIAMASEDKVFCQAIRDNYDVHMEWAERIAEVHPRVLKKHGDDMRKLRSTVKNSWVFPLFYGAGYVKCANLLGMTEGKARNLMIDFWDQFLGVKGWHKEAAEFYRKNGYVESLTGRRRRAPLSFNMIINTPIQATASDITVDAMNRISEYADANDLEWMRPVLNIHDDLTFLVPDKHVPRAIKLITRMMERVPFDWVNVPIEVDVKVGYTWGEMSRWREAELRDTAPYVKGSATSKAAATSVEPILNAMQIAVYEVIKTGPRTCDEVEVELNMRHQTASARIKELRDAGLIEDSGMTRKTRSGRAAVVWEDRA